LGSTLWQRLVLQGRFEGFYMLAFGNLCQVNIELRRQLFQFFHNAIVAEQPGVGFIAVDVLFPISGGNTGFAHAALRVDKHERTALFLINRLPVKLDNDGFRLVGDCFVVGLFLQILLRC